MKNKSISRLVISILALSAVAFVAVGANGSSKGTWPGLPRLALKKCVGANVSVTHNPFSNFSNDFLVITAYEEHIDGGPVIKKESESNSKTDWLNAYMVRRAFMKGDKPAGPALETTLIIEEKNAVSRPQGKSTSVSMWVLGDVNGDGVVDKMMYGQGEAKNVPADKIHSLKEVAVPPADFPVLQRYFTKAVHSLAERAMVGTSETCSRS